MQPIILHLSVKVKYFLQNSSKSFTAFLQNTETHQKKDRPLQTVKMAEPDFPVFAMGSQAYIKYFL